MKIKEVFNKGFKEITLKKYAIILLEYLMVLAFVNNFLLWLNNDLNIGGGLIALLVICVILFIYDPLTRGALMHNAAFKTTFNQSFKQVKKNYLLIIKTLLLMTVIAIPNYLINMQVYNFFTPLIAAVIIIFIEASFGIPQYLLYPSAVIHNLSPIKALKNSVKLIINNKSIAIKAYLLTSFITLIISLIAFGRVKLQPGIIGFTNAFIYIVIIRVTVTSFIDLFNINIRSIITHGTEILKRN